jgi:Type I phosphodiesterase / nucleotide pyrophosphatase
VRPKTLLVLVAAATLIATVMVVKVVRLNGSLPPADILGLGAWFLAGGLVVSGIGMLAFRIVASVGARLRGQRTGEGWTLALAVSAALSTLAVLMSRYVFAAWKLPSAAVGLAGLTGFVAVAIVTPRWRVSLACAFFLALSAALVWTEVHRPPEAIELARRSEPTGPIEAGFTRSRPQRLVLVGLDGLDPTVVERLIAEGSLPTFARLRPLAARARIKTIRPTLSPVIWSTIATGTAPESHGIHDFLVWHIAGVSRPIARLPYFLGLWRVAIALERIGLVERRTLPSSLLRDVPLWRAVSLAGATVFVENWWASTPVETVNGIALSNANGFGFHHRANPLGRNNGRPYAFPAEWWSRLLDVDAELRRTPVIQALREATTSPDPPIDYQLVGVERADECYTRLAEQALAERPFDLGLLYFRGTDVAVHATGAFSDVFNPRSGPSAYRSSVRRFYERADARLARVIAVAGEGSYVVVVSDHGFDPFRPGLKIMGHTGAPDGVFWLIGPDVAPGVLEDVHVLDVAPTVLHIMGFPVPTTMIGRVPTEAFRPDSPLATIRRCGPFPEPWKSAHYPAAGGTNLDIEKSQIEELKALGYIR